MYCIEMSLATVPAQRTFVLSGSAPDWTDLFNRYSKCNAQVHILLGAQEKVLISFKIKRKKLKF